MLVCMVWSEETTMTTCMCAHEMMASHAASSAIGMDRRGLDPFHSELDTGAAKNIIQRNRPPRRVCGPSILFSVLCISILQHMKNSRGRAFNFVENTELLMFMRLEGRFSKCIIHRPNWYTHIHRIHAFQSRCLWATTLEIRGPLCMGMSCQKCKCAGSWLQYSLWFGFGPSAASTLRTLENQLWPRAWTHAEHSNLK